MPSTKRTRLQLVTYLAPDLKKAMEVRRRKFGETFRTQLESLLRRSSKYRTTA